MTPDERKRAAQSIIAIPFFGVVISEMEKTAIDCMVNAQYADHEARQAYSAEVRAIRKFRRSLETLASGDNPKALGKTPV